MLSAWSRMFSAVNPLNAGCLQKGHALTSACAVNQPCYGGFIWTRSDGLTWLRLDDGQRLDLAPPRAAAGSPAAAGRGESCRRPAWFG